MFGQEAVVAVRRVKHTLISVVYKVKEVFLGVSMIEHGIIEFCVIESDEVLFEVEQLKGWRNVFFIVIGERFFFDQVEDFGG